MKETANRIVDAFPGAQIETYYEHAIFGFNVAGVSREMLEALLENDEVLGIEEVRTQEDYF